MRVLWRAAGGVAVAVVLVYVAWRLEERREVAVVRDAGYRAWRGNR